MILDRDRGGAYVATFIAGAGLFGTFFLLTYYLQQTLGYSPLVTGVAAFSLETDTVSPLLSSVGEASPESATYLLTAVAAGFVLLNGDGDVITAHRLLTQAIEDQARPYRISDTGVGRPGGRRAQGNRANPTPRRSASIRLAHAAGTPDRAAGRRRPDQQGDRPAASHVTPDGRSPPVPDLSQTWHNHPGSAARRARLPALRAPRRESRLTVTSKKPGAPSASFVHRESLISMWPRLREPHARREWERN